MRINTQLVVVSALVSWLFCGCNQPANGNSASAATEPQSVVPSMPPAAIPASTNEMTASTNDPYASTNYPSTNTTDRSELREPYMETSTNILPTAPPLITTPP